MKKILFLIGLISICSFSEGGLAKALEDPFVSLLPTEIAAAVEGKKTVPVSLEVSVEGVLWGTDVPMAIIDGEVYKVGDTLLNVDAKVFSIEDNRVSLFYSGRLFVKSAQKRGGK
ncbi:MAG: hypothetical protein PHV17_05500 [Candidatus Omnitrophica bacterium]|nr:hypothetical protein [Candidatus Omnitrophota bacterium]